MQWSLLSVVVSLHPPSLSFILLKGGWGWAASLADCMHCHSFIFINCSTCLKSFKKRKKKVQIIFLMFFFFFFLFNQVCTINTSNNQYNCYTADITIDTAVILQTYPLIQLLHCRNNSQTQTATTTKRTEAYYDKASQVHLKELVMSNSNWKWSSWIPGTGGKKRICSKIGRP